MFGFGRSKKKLSEQERSTIYFSLVTVGCLFFSMTTKKINGDQYYLLLVDTKKYAGNSDQNDLAQMFTDQLVQLNGMPPHDILDFFKKGRDLNRVEQASILYNCISYALLEDNESYHSLFTHFLKTTRAITLY